MFTHDEYLMSIFVTYFVIYILFSPFWSDMSREMFSKFHFSNLVLAHLFICYYDYGILINYP
jgi:hypothetical protein